MRWVARPKRYVTRTSEALDPVPAVLRAESNAYQHLAPLVEESMRVVGSVCPGTVVRVPPEGASTGRRRKGRTNRVRL